jgi:hypothetical protein
VIAQLVEQVAVNHPVPGSSPGHRALLFISNNGFDMNRNMTIEDTIKEVRRAVSLIYGGSDSGFVVDDDTIDCIAARLHPIRMKPIYSTCSLRMGGSSIIPWVKHRLEEMGKLPKCSGQYAVEDNLVTAVLHFVPWDEEKYGPTFSDIEHAIKNLKESTSAVHKLSEAKPINKTAAKVTKSRYKSCPYCSRVFLNKAAVNLHVRDVHPEHFKIIGKKFEFDDKKY